MHNEPFREVPMEIWDDAGAGAPLANVKDHIAVVTTSGVVPGQSTFQTYRNTYWRKYNIAEVKELEPENGKCTAVTTSPI
jgi:hypothetical protein